MAKETAGTNNALSAGAFAAPPPNPADTIDQNARDADLLSGGTQTPAPELAQAVATAPMPSPVAIAAHPVEIDIREATTKFHRLDMKKPYGEIHGTGMGEAAYEQWGFPYNKAGSLLTDMLNKTQVAELKKHIAHDMAMKNAKQTMRDVLRAQGFEEDDIDRLTDIDLKTTPDQLIKAGVKTDIDLRAWASGQVDYPFDHVQAAMRATLGKQVMSLPLAIDLLGEHYKIPADRLRRSA